MYIICNETVQLQSVVLFKMSFFFLLWHQSSWFCISNEQQIKQRANGLTCDGGAGVLSSPLERSGLLPDSQACVGPDKSRSVWLVAPWSRLSKPSDHLPSPICRLFLLDISSLSCHPVSPEKIQLIWQVWQSGHDSGSWMNLYTGYL